MRLQTKCGVLSRAVPNVCFVYFHLNDCCGACKLLESRVISIKYQLYCSLVFKYLGVILSSLKTVYMCSVPPRWVVHMEGAAGTLYEGEKFQLQFKFSPKYPFDSPEVRCT